MFYRQYYSVKAIFFVPMTECQMLAAIVKKRGGEHLKANKSVPFVNKTPLSLHWPEEEKKILS